MASVEGAIDTFKDLVWDNIVEVGLKAFYVKFSFLSWGPVRAFISFILKYALDELYAAFKDYTIVQAIALKDKDLQKEYATAAYALKNAALTNGLTSVEYRKARDEHKAKLAERIKFRRTA